MNRHLDNEYNLRQGVATKKLILYTFITVDRHLDSEWTLNIMNTLKQCMNTYNLPKANSSEYILDIEKHYIHQHLENV